MNYKIKIKIKYSEIIEKSKKSKESKNRKINLKI